MTKASRYKLDAPADCIGVRVWSGRLIGMVIGVGEDAWVPVLFDYPYPDDLAHLHQGTGEVEVNPPCHSRDEAVQILLGEYNDTEWLRRSFRAPAERVAQIS